MLLNRSRATGRNVLGQQAHESGRGPWLVLLHGLAGAWPIWRPIIRILEQRFRVLALTLPGHDGGATWPEGREPAVDAIADELVQELQYRGIHSAHIVGNSLGGWLALELARRGVADSVTALSPAGGWQTDRDYMKVARPFRWLCRLLPWISWLLSPLMRFAVVRRFLFAQTMNHAERMSVGEARTALRGFRRCTVLPGLLASMRRKGPIQPLRVPSVPIMIAWGEGDQVIPFESYGRPMTMAVPDADVVEVPDAGHVPMYDAPDRIAALICQTVDRASEARGAA